jgi:hypothetical protein
MSSNKSRNYYKEFEFADGKLAKYAQQFRIHMESQRYSQATIYQYECSLDVFFEVLRNGKIDI